MTKMLNGIEMEAIKAMLRFANLQRIESVAEAERCFENIKDFISSDEAMWRLLKLTVWQIAVCAWLASITESQRERRAVMTEVAPLVKKSVKTALVFKNEELGYECRFQSVHAVCAFAVALILSKRRRLASRLQRCICGRFNLDLHPKGRPKKYCSPKHKALADAMTLNERVRKSQLKHKMGKKS